MTKVLTEPHGFRVIYRGAPQPTLHSTLRAARLELQRLRCEDYRNKSALENLERPQWMH